MCWWRKYSVDTVLHIDRLRQDSVRSILRKDFK
jgi:hypothetical protein